MSDGEPFGFAVRAVNLDEWKVVLPHQCGAWAITGEGDDDASVSHEEALRELRRFISEAHDALTMLRRREPWSAERKAS